MTVVQTQRKHNNLVFDRTSGVTRELAVLHTSSPHAAWSLVIPVTEGFSHGMTLGCKCTPALSIKSLTVDQAGVEVVAIGGRAGYHGLYLLDKHCIEVLKELHIFRCAIIGQTWQHVDARELCCVVHGVQDKQWSLDIVVDILCRKSYSHYGYNHNGTCLLEQTCTSTCLRPYVALCTLGWGLCRCSGTPSLRNNWQIIINLSDRILLALTHFDTIYK